MTGPCADCFAGTIATGTPTGTTATIHGLPTYVASPDGDATPKGIVVMIPDAFGWEFVNNRLLCDTYAKKGGFLVYLPDFMAGGSMSIACLPVMEKITTPASWLTTLLYKPLYVAQALYYALPWMVSARSSVCKPRVIKFFQALRTSPPPFQTSSLKIAAAGFCWGGQHTFALAADTPSSRASSPGQPLQRLIDCAFTAHPSFVTVPGDVEAVTVPISVAVGDEDMAMKGPLAKQMKDILEVKKRGDHEVVIMPGAKHGFAIRAVPSEGGKQREMADQAEKQALDWFTRWMT